MDTQIAREQLRKIADLFASKSLPTVASKKFLAGLDIPSTKWSLGNNILMWLARTDDARGYRQWQEVGRHVKKGAKAFYILGPVIVKKKTRDEETGEEREEAFLAGFKTIPVFRYEDTDGKPLPEPKPQHLPPLMEVAEKWGVKVKYQLDNPKAYGSYDLKDEIHLATDDPATFFHELAHVAHSKLEEVKPGQDPAQEAIAELTAATLARIYGFDADSHAWHYIAHYAGEKSPEAVGRLCYSILAKVERIITMILREAPALLPLSR